MASASNHPDIEPLVPLQLPSRAPAPMRQRPRRNWTKWALLVGIVIALGTAAEIWEIHSANAVNYETVTVGRGQVQASVTATGTLNPVVDVQVGSQVSGNIIALYADFNTKVTKGQLVAQIDPQAFQTQVDQATAALASVHSSVLTAGAQEQKAQSDLAGTMANEKGVESILAKDQANAVNATNQYQRQDSAFTKGLISQQDHDLAKATVDAAEAQVAADQSQINASKQTILSAQDQLNVAKDQEVSAQAQERQSQASLERRR